MTALLLVIGPMLVGEGLGGPPWPRSGRFGAAARL
jgi:hypothetical protein